jgi:hypothetical protein
MHRTLIPAIAVCSAILVFAGPRAALSTPASAALPYGETNAGVLHVVKSYRYSRNWRGRPYYRVKPIGIPIIIGPMPITVIPGTTAGPASASGLAFEAGEFRQLVQL